MRKQIFPNFFYSINLGVDKVYNAEKIFWMALLYRKIGRSNQWKCLFSKNRGINEEIKKFYPKSAQKRFWVCFEGKIKFHQMSNQILLLIMFLTSRMNFMIIGYDLGLLGRKYFLVIFGHFWGRLSFDLKILARKKWSRDDLLTSQIPT